jgi:cyclophilin family peptidyl-prolyl cis-trans isomerase
MALLDAIAVHVAGDDALELTPLLKDFDPRVAQKAAEIVIRATGKPALPEPIPIVRGSTPSPFSELRQCALVEMDSGKSFRMKMRPEVAPVTVERFLKLAADRYYDGLTIHRIVPNFVIQGGSPGANEYVGHREFMRDEVNAPNDRGTVGLSTRGRNTGDAQFFVNLVDNPRLNDDYTVFATIDEMPVVDAIQEGDVMRRITIGRCPR